MWGKKQQLRTVLKIKVVLFRLTFKMQVDLSVIVHWPSLMEGLSHEITSSASIAKSVVVNCDDYIFFSTFRPWSACRGPTTADYCKLQKWNVIYIICILFVLLICSTSLLENKHFSWDRFFWLNKWLMVKLSQSPLTAIKKYLFFVKYSSLVFKFIFHRLRLYCIC